MVKHKEVRSKAGGEVVGYAGLLAAEKMRHVVEVSWLSEQRCVSKVAFVAWISACTAEVTARHCSGSKLRHAILTEGEHRACKDKIV
jgi:hypothetical protein